MKLRKLLAGFICLVLVTIITASSSVFAEEISVTESTESNLTNSEINEYNTELASVLASSLPLNTHIFVPSNFKCVEGEESSESLQAIVKLNGGNLDYYPNIYIEWSTPDSDLISIKNPHSMKTTIIGLKPGQATVNLTVKLSDKKSGSARKTINVTPKAGTGINYPGPGTPPSSYNSNYEETTEVYRLYLAANNEHLYTTDANEVRELEAAGWANEGVCWNAPFTGDPVYRLYSPVTNEHLYTKDKSEVNNLEANGWTVDKNGQPLFNSGGTKPIYRLYHEGTQRHHLTANKAENDALSSNGWSSEGTALNAVN